MMIRVIFIVFAVCHMAGALIGGKKYTIGSFPHTAVLTSTRNGEERLMGGGSLITPTVILTAAHHLFYEDAKVKPKTLFKYKPNELYATVGVYDLLNPERGHMWGEPTEIIIHEDYNSDYDSKNFNADIALLKFANGPFRVGPHIMPIPLMRDEIKSKTIVRRGTVAGCWGESNTTRTDFKARYAVVKTRPKDQCFDENSRKVKDATDLSHVFCVGEENVGFCGGDSGSGLIIKVNDNYYLKGITIGGIFDQKLRCTAKLNTLFTDVVKFVPWIDKHLGDLPKKTKTTKQPDLKTKKIEISHDELRR